MRSSIISLALLIFLGSGLVAKADIFTGDTISVSINFTDADFAVFEDASPNGFETLTIGGPTVSVTSAFDPTVTLEFTAIEVDNGPTCDYFVIVEALDALGNRANPIADGTLSAGGAAFTGAFIDVGVFNGGTDGFDKNTPQYEVVSSFTGILDTAGDDTLGFGGLNFQSNSPDPLSFFGGGNFGADIATLNFSSIDPGFPNGEFAGWVVGFTVQVPEPATATLGMFALGLVGLKATSLDQNDK